MLSRNHCSACFFSLPSSSPGLRQQILQLLSREFMVDIVLSRCLYNAGMALKMASSCSDGVIPLLLSIWLCFESVMS